MSHAATDGNPADGPTMHHVECDGWTALSHRQAIVATTEYSREGDTDAEFIAHARQDVPALVAALRAVLALHAEMEMFEIDPANGTWNYGADGEKRRLPSVCSECTPSDTLREIEECDWEDSLETVLHPCPTVAAITAALDPS